MKLKKLAAIVLAGAMALTVLTGCGNSVSNKTIVDALNDMAKADDNGITFTQKTELNAKAKTFAEALKKAAEADPTVLADENEDGEVKPAESVDASKLTPATANTYMWISIVKTKGMNTTAQAHTVYEEIIDEDNAINVKNVPQGKVPADAREIGFASITVKGENYRLVLATAAAEDVKKPEEPSTPVTPSNPDDKKDDNTGDSDNAGTGDGNTEEGEGTGSDAE